MATFNGLGMPLYDADGNDFITVDSNGDIVLNQSGQTQADFRRLQLAVLTTAPASAGLTKGDIWLHKVTTDIYRIALCISTATGLVHRMRRLELDVTLGSAS